MALLKGKTAVITGGSTGIGLATAKRFAEEGAYVFINGRSQAELDAAVREIGENVTGVQGDGSKADAAIMAALRSSARTWASELRDRKIRVYVISPDATETPGIDLSSFTAGADIPGDDGPAEGRNVTGIGNHGPFDRKRF
jgi:NAD(P)-dependent dehydrogenase (short-subunit alcohol dehydrogenase family)